MGKYAVVQNIYISIIILITHSYLFIKSANMYLILAVKQLKHVELVMHGRRVVRDGPAGVSIFQCCLQPMWALQGHHLKFIEILYQF